MASEVLKLTTEIVVSHAAMTALTPKELVKEIKEVYKVLVSLESEVIVPEATAPVVGARPVKMLESPGATAIQDTAGPVLGDPDYMEFMASREG